MLTPEKIDPKTLDGLVTVECVCTGMFSFSLLNF